MLSKASDEYQPTACTAFPDVPHQVMEGESFFDDCERYSLSSRSTYLEVPNMSPFIPVWIIGGPFIGLLILSFSFKGPSAMGGTAPRLPQRGRSAAIDPAAPMFEPMHPAAPRRTV
jgi:hypothetical protein